MSTVSVFVDTDELEVIDKCTIGFSPLKHRCSSRTPTQSPISGLIKQHSLQRNATSPASCANVSHFLHHHSPSPFMTSSTTSSLVEATPVMSTGVSMENALRAPLRRELSSSTSLFSMFAPSRHELSSKERALSPASLKQKESGTKQKEGGSATSGTVATPGKQPSVGPPYRPKRWTFSFVTVGVDFDAWYKAVRVDDAVLNIWNGLEAPALILSGQNTTVVQCLQAQLINQLLQHPFSRVDDEELPYDKVQASLLLRGKDVFRLSSRIVEENRTTAAGVTVAIIQDPAPLFRLLADKKSPELLAKELVGNVQRLHPVPGVHCLLHVTKYIDASGTPKIDLGLASRVRQESMLHVIPVSLGKEEELAFLEGKVNVADADIDSFQLQVEAEEELARMEKTLEWVLEAKSALERQRIKPKPRKCFHEKNMLMQRLEEEAKTAGVRLDELARELRALYTQVHRGRDLFPQEDRDAMVFEDVLAHSLRYTYHDRDLERDARLNATHHASVLRTQGSAVSGHCSESAYVEGRVTGDMAGIVGGTRTHGAMGAEHRQHGQATNRDAQDMVRRAEGNGKATSQTTATRGGFRFTPTSDSEDYDDVRVQCTSSNASLGVQLVAEEGDTEEFEWHPGLTLERYEEDQIEVRPGEWKLAWALVQRCLFNHPVLLIGSDAPKVLEMVILCGRQIPGAAQFLIYPELESLSLRLEPQCIAPLIQVLQNHAQSIRTLSLSGDTEWSMLRPTLKKLMNLTSLSIVDASHFEAEALLQEVPKSLEDIDLSRSCATGSWRFLTCCRRLKKLRMRSAGLDGEDAVDLALWLPIFEGLENLDLAENNINEEGALKLLHVLHFVPSSLVVNLSQNNIRRAARLSNDWDRLRNARTNSAGFSMPTVLGI